MEEKEELLEEPDNYAQSNGGGPTEKPQVTPGLGGSFRCHRQQVAIPTIHRTRWVAASGQVTPAGDTLPRFCNPDLFVPAMSGFNLLGSLLNLCACAANFT